MKYIGDKIKIRHVSLVWIRFILKWFIKLKQSLILLLNLLRII